MEIDWKGNEIVGIMETRRHYSNYFRGLPHFKDYRLKLVTSNELISVNKAFDQILKDFENYE